MSHFHYLPAAVLVATITLTCAVSRVAAAKSPLSLAESLEAWVTLVEKDDLKTASERWGRDAGAGEALTQHWARLKQCHKEHNYRNWLEKDRESGGVGAKQIGDATTFTVGGHSFGHLHVKWEKGESGWRISSVFQCR